MMGLVVDSLHISRLILLVDLFPRDILWEILTNLGHYYYSRMYTGVLGRSYHVARRSNVQTIINNNVSCRDTTDTWLFINKTRGNGWYGDTFYYININPRSDYFNYIKIDIDNIGESMFLIDK